MVFGRVQSSKRKQGKENDLRSSDRKTSQKELPPIWRLQQSIGNQASSQLLEAANPLAPMTEAGKGIALHLQHMVALFATKAVEEGEQKLWNKFEQLTVGQRQALINEWFAQSSADVFPSWSQFSQDIETMHYIPLQRDEPYEEGNITELGESIPPYAWKTTGLLAPYKEIWLWLGYKGNKQGQIDILKQLDGLTREQKQLLLHRIVGNKRLSLYQFSKQLTIEKDLKQWVDWSRIEQMIHTIEGLSKQQVEQQLELIQSEQLEGQEDIEQLELEAEQAGDDSEDDFSALLSLLTDETMEQEDSEKTIEQQFSTPEDIFQLLFGIPLGDGKQPDAIATKEQLIDRVLGIHSNVPAKNKERILSQMLKEKGYASVEQLFMHIKQFLIERLVQQGIIEKNELILLILQKLQLVKGKQKTSKEQVAARIHAIQ